MHDTGFIDAEVLLDYVDGKTLANPRRESRASAGEGAGMARHQWAPVAGLVALPMQGSLYFLLVESDYEASIDIDNGDRRLARTAEHFLRLARIRGHVALGEADAILLEKLFRDAAIAAAWRGVDSHGHRYPSL
jgi:hypothetical protein